MTVATLAMAGTAAASVMVAPTARSAPSPCPPFAPLSTVNAGDVVSGLTVSRGTAPEGFTGSVIGRLDDGIAPGIDMIMVDLTSPEIDRVGGIWAGMSGSPVYDAQDRLIGAVAYGLAGTTPVAGVTPARQMYQLITNAPTRAAAARSLATARSADDVAIPRPMARRLAARSGVNAAQMSAGMERLPMPVSVSGLTQNRIGKLDRKLGLGGVRYYRAGSASAAAVGDPTDIIAGGNLAATMSYGDLTAGGVGTVTAVCGQQVLGFGHPANWTGTSTMTMHGADAVFVQRDPAFVPFKAANITGRVGRISQDRLAGISGRTGTTPVGAGVRSHVWTTDGRSRVGRTTVTVPDALPDLAVFAQLANLDRTFDGVSDGTARVRLIVKGKRPDGNPFTLDRMDRFASPGDITFESIFGPYEQLAALQYYAHGRPRISSVDFRAEVDDRLRLFTITGADVLRSGRWVKARPRMLVQVKGGNTLKVRLHLASHRNLAGKKVVRADMVMPRSRAGRTGLLTFTGGNDSFSEEDFFGESTSSGPRTFKGLLRKLDRELRNDAVVAKLARSEFGSAWRSRRVNVGQVVGGQVGLRVRITR